MNGAAPMGMGMGGMSSIISQAPGVRLRRYGCMAARIGSEHMYRTTIAASSGIKYALTQTVMDRHGVPVGTKVQMGVNDLTQFPELADKVKWTCTHPECRAAKKSWSTKAALLAGHDDNRLLAQREEVHLYFAVVELAAVAARPAKTDKDGKVTEPAVEGRDALVMLLSDEA